MAQHEIASNQESDAVFGEKRTVLLVYGDTDLRKLYKNQLMDIKKIHASVLEAGNLSEARDKIREIPPEERDSLIVILDPKLPKESGIELLEEQSHKDSWLRGIPIHVAPSEIVSKGQKRVYLNLGAEGVWNRLDMNSLKRIVINPKIRKLEKAS